MNGELLFSEEGKTGSPLEAGRLSAVSEVAGKWALTGALLVAAAFFFLYASLFPPLIAEWWDNPDYSHGFFVPPLSAFLLWERRERLLQAPLAPTWWGAVVLVFGLCLLLIGNWGAELFLTRLSMIVILSGLILSLFGIKALKVVSFPLGFLVFMIPLPTLVLNSVTFPLQLFAAKISTAVLQMMEIPVYREGNVIFLPYATLEVAEACSGIRSLIALVALAMVTAYWIRIALWRRFFLLGSAVPIAIAANSFRIVGTGILSHAYDPETAEGFYHAFAGLLVFVLAATLLFAVGFALTRMGAGNARSK